MSVHRHPIMKYRQRASQSTVILNAVIKKYHSWRIIIPSSTLWKSGPGSVVGVTTAYGLDGPGIESRWGEIFRTYPDRPWGPPSLLYNGYRVVPGGKGGRGRGVEHPPPSSAEVLRDLQLYLYSSSGPFGSVTVFLYLLPYESSWNC